MHRQPWINVPGQKLIILNIRNCAEETVNKQYLAKDHNKTDAWKNNTVPKVVSEKEPFICKWSSIFFFMWPLLLSRSAACSVLTSGFHEELVSAVKEVIIEFPSHLHRASCYRFLGTRQGEERVTSEKKGVVGNSWA